MQALSLKKGDVVRFYSVSPWEVVVEITRLGTWGLAILTEVGNQKVRRMLQTGTEVEIRADNGGPHE